MPPLVRLGLRGSNLFDQKPLMGIWGVTINGTKSYAEDCLWWIGIRPGFIGQAGASEQAQIHHAIKSHKVYFLKPS